MLQRYYYTVKVINKFEDTINLCVEAAHAGEARKLIRSAMEVYPKAVEGTAIKHCYIEDRNKLQTEVVGITRTVGIPVDEIT